MSYTPPEQLLDEPMRMLTLGIEEVRNALWERVKNQREGGWTDEHIKKCRKEIKKLTKMELRLRELY